MSLTRPPRLVAPAQHAVQRPSAPHTLPSGARLHMAPAGHDNISWLLEYAPGLAAVIDGPSATDVMRYCGAYKLRPTHLLNTHTHADHIGLNEGIAAWAECRGVPLEVWGPASRASEVPCLTRGLREGDAIALGGLRGEVWVTEGHLNGHLSFVFEGVVFCGDTLFGAGCGYLFDGPAWVMRESLERLAALPEGTLVCCAHEYTLDNLHFALTAPTASARTLLRARSARERREAGMSTLPSTIGLERETNPFLLAPREAFAALRAEKDSKRYRARPLMALEADLAATLGLPGLPLEERA
jgi:hydroxyacylglutathione hydrolase